MALASPVSFSENGKLTDRGSERNFFFFSRDSWTLMNKPTGERSLQVSLVKLAIKWIDLRRYCSIAYCDLFDNMRFALSSIVDFRVSVFNLSLICLRICVYYWKESERIVRWILWDHLRLIWLNLIEWALICAPVRV